MNSLEANIRDNSTKLFGAAMFMDRDHFGRQKNNKIVTYFPNVTGQNRKESRKILIGWLQKHRLPTRFCLAFLVRYKTFQATHNVGPFPPRRYKIRNVGQFPPRRCISDVRLFPPRSCNVRPFPPGRPRDASSREEASLWRPEGNGLTLQLLGGNSLTSEM